MKKDIKTIIVSEEKRQNETINLIASENYPSKKVREIYSSIFSSKYAEGYPGKRYYAGCKNVDEAEMLGIELAKKVFKVKFANVQPHSGSNANLAAYFALLEPGDKILAPRLDCGGHLTHGSPASITSKLWRFEHYGVNESGIFDYENILKLTKKFKPKLIIAGTSAYPLCIDWKKFREIADSVGAYLLTDIAHLSGLIAGGKHNNPSGFAHIITTTTQKTLRGPRGGIIMTNDPDLAKKIDKMVFPKLQGGPHMHTILAKAKSLEEADSKDFKKYISQVIRNSKTLHDELVKLGCIMWSNKTETHLTNINTVESFGISGKEAEEKLEQMGIIVNRESFPYDKMPPTETSGIRIGTPAMTTRGMKEKEMKIIAEMIFEILKNNSKLNKEIKSLAIKFPVK